MANLFAYLALFGAALIYAINYDVAKVVMVSNIVPPFTFILFRAVGACAVFWTISTFYKSEKIERKDYFKLLLCGLFGVAGNQLMFFEGLHHTSTINASIIMTTNPILVLIMASLIIKEKVSLSKILGIALGISGAAFLIVDKNTASGSASVYGDLMVLGNATSYGIYLVMAKPLMRKYSPLTFVKWVFLFGLIFIIPIGYGGLQSVNWQMSGDMLLRILYVVLFTTCLAYFLNIFGLQRVGPTITSCFIYLQPLIASFIAIALQKEVLTWSKSLYGLLIFTGVFLVISPWKEKVRIKLS